MTDARTFLDRVDARTNAAIRDLPYGAIRPGAIRVAVRTDLPAATTALRAVLDLHRPIGAGFTGTVVFRGRCEPCARVYPCPTVTAITTALKDGA